MVDAAARGLPDLAAAARLRASAVRLNRSEVRYQRDVMLGSVAPPHDRAQLQAECCRQPSAGATLQHPDAEVRGCYCSVVNLVDARASHPCSQRCCGHNMDAQLRRVAGSPFA